MTIYLIRHATPDWSRKDISYHIPPGPPLTAQGLQEAQVLGEYLQLVGVQCLFSSPLERALHTAKIAAARAKIPFEIYDALREWQTDEIEADVRARVYPLFEAVARMDGMVGLVTHGGPIAVLLASLGMDEDTLKAQRVYDHGNPLPPAGAWEVQHNGAGWEMHLAFIPQSAVARG